jgi:hypothetical protein
MSADINDISGLLVAPLVLWRSVGGVLVLWSRIRVEELVSESISTPVAFLSL